jgi:hypothetical protein
VTAASAWRTQAAYRGLAPVMQSGRGNWPAFKCSRRPSVTGGLAKDVTSASPPQVTMRDDTSFRALSDWERQMLLQMLVPAFPGRDELRVQLLEGLEARDLDEDGSVELRPNSEVKECSAEVCEPPVRGARHAPKLAFHHPIASI